MADASGTTPLLRACAGGSLATVRVLLKHGADVEKQNIAQQTPLFTSCLCAFINITKLLLDGGAKVSTCASGGE